MPNPNSAQLVERVFSAYEAIGAAPPLIAEWAISTNDVSDLLQEVQSARPRRILEVGTYVGVSTMLMALACPDAEIFTFDPDFPLALEMKAVGSAISESSPTTLTLARQAAKQLGVADRVRFFKGGFSVGDTFTSTLADATKRVPVVGPEVCARHGPFDFAFIDGLHTPDAVLRDLELSSAHLSPDATIALHDCIGFWGASVRDGIFEFLRRHRDFVFLHAPYQEVYKSIGIVRCRHPDLERFFREPGAAHTEALAAALAGVALATFGSQRVLEIAVVRTWLDTGMDRWVIDEQQALNAELGDLAGVVETSPAPALAAIELADFASEQTIGDVLRAAAAAGKPVLLGVTTPGERHITGPRSRPLARLVDLADTAGSSLYLLPTAGQEHARYGMLPEPRALSLSSQFLTFVVASPHAFSDAYGRVLPRLDAALAREIEQAELQRTHLAAGFRQLNAMTEDLRRQAREQVLEARKLRLQIAEQESDRQDLQRQLREQVAEGAKLRSFVAGQEDGANDLRRQVREQTAETDLLRADGEDLRRQVREQTSEAERLRADGEDLRRQVREQTSEAERLRADGDDLRRHAREQALVSEGLRLEDQSLRDRVNAMATDSANQLRRTEASEESTAELARRMLVLYGAMDAIDRHSAKLADKLKIPLSPVPTVSDSNDDESLLVSAVQQLLERLDALLQAVPPRATVAEQVAAAGRELVATGRGLGHSARRIARAANARIRRMLSNG